MRLSEPDGATLADVVTPEQAETLERTLREAQAEAEGAGPGAVESFRLLVRWLLVTPCGDRLPAGVAVGLRALAADPAASARVSAGFRMLALRLQAREGRGALVSVVARTWPPEVYGRA